MIEIKNVINVDLTEFLRLREKIFECLRHCLEEDDHCKSYEGALSVEYILPNYFEKKVKTPSWNIHLDCYLIGPERHYDWQGKTFEDVLAKATKDIECWIKECY